MPQLLPLSPAVLLLTYWAHCQWGVQAVPLVGLHHQRHYCLLLAGSSPLPVYFLCEASATADLGQLSWTLCCVSELDSWVQSHRLWCDSLLGPLAGHRDRA